MTTPVFIFQTTHHALWAEEIAEGAGIPAEVIPAPAESRAKCDLALRTRSHDIPALADKLREEAVEFGVWPPPDASGA